MYDLGRGGEGIFSRMCVAGPVCRCVNLHHSRPELHARSLLRCAIRRDSYRLREWRFHIFMKLQEFRANDQTGMELAV